MYVLIYIPSSFADTILPIYLAIYVIAATFSYSAINLISLTLAWRLLTPSQADCSPTPVCQSPHCSIHFMYVTLKRMRMYEYGIPIRMSAS
eukprot:6176346-Pleurochrysis_carterae.AAC.1